MRSSARSYCWWPRWAFAAGLTFAVALPARGAIPDCWVSYYTLFQSTNYIYLFNTGTRELRRIYNSGNVNPTNAAFSPDGKRMAFMRKKDNDTGSIWIMNNDGSGLRRLCATFERSAVYYGGTSTVCWTEQGLYWGEKTNRIFWANPETGESKSIGTLATNTVGNLLSMSLDGSRGYLRTDHETAAQVGGLFFGVNTATKTLINERPFGAYMWDHGSAMLQDGSGVLWVIWNCGAFGYPPGCVNTHNRLGIVNYDNMSSYSVIVPPDDGQDTLMISGPSGGPYSTPSSPDLFLYRRGGWSPFRCVIFNYKTLEMIDATARNFAPGSPITALPNLSLQGSFWAGQLPSPHTTEPFLAVNKSVVQLVSQAAAAVFDTVTVTNTGAGTLTTVTVAKAPASAWLTIENLGAGNTQRLALRADPGGLANGDYQCVVTVSGGGAANSVTFTVRLTVGSALLPPSNLNYTLNGETWQELDALITWRDNTTAETGFALDRRTGTGPFSRIAVLAANAVSFLDTAVVRGSTYAYRLRAFAGSDTSTFSETLTVSIPDYFIVVTSPQAGETYRLGEPLAIRWTAPTVTTVQIEYTINDGEDWGMVTATGGISQGSPNWGNFAWTPPVSLGVQPRVQVRVSEYQNVGTSNCSGVFSLVASTGARPAVPRIARSPGLDVRRSEGTLLVTYRVAQQQRATIEVYDMRGRVAARCEPPSGSGSCELRLGGETTVYVVRLLACEPQRGTIAPVSTRISGLARQ